MAFNNIIGRADVASAALPDTVVSEIIQESPKSSIILDRARRVNMSKAKSKQPVLASLPSAYWVDGDTGLKQTSSADWKDLTMTAEELAVIVPIPDALVADSDIPLWDEIKPLLVEAIGQKIDEAAIFGVDKPTSWPEGIVPQAIAAGNAVVRGTNPDLAGDIAELGKLVARDGFAVNGFASMPGYNWELIGMRSQQGTPIYTPSLAAGTPAGLYGYALNESFNGAWHADAAELLAADWSKFVVGVRQDITFDLFSEGVISDADGKVILNLMQQDTKALRVVFRAGFQIANPKTRANADDLTRFPAGVITPVAEPVSPEEG